MAINIWNYTKTNSVRVESEKQRMITEQLLSRGITDKRVIDAMIKVPRHLFVEQALSDRAYGDYPLPIGCNQTISQPYMVALMTQCLRLQGDERVLEIGTGSGYQSAVLAELTAKVYTIERVKTLFEKAQKTLIDRLRYKNIVLIVGDGNFGLNNFAPYDRIIVTAGAPDVPKPLIDQLADPGILVIPRGDRYSQVMLIVEKRDGRLLTTEAGGCVFVPLVGKYGWENGE